MDPQHILIIDDSPAIHALVRARLASSRVTLAFANGGMAGLAMAADPVPDLILLDVDMPAPDGFEVCRRLKADPRTRDVPVIFLTGATTTDDKLKGLTLGAVDYISKPFDPAELKARVNASLRTRELMALLARQAAVERRRAQVLQMIAENQPPNDVMARLTALLEEQYPRAYASVVLLADGQLRHVAPNLPQHFRDAMDQRLLRVTAALCSDTVTSGANLAAGEFADDPRWAELRDAAGSDGLVSFWAHVLRVGGGDPLGMLAVFHRERARPDEPARTLLQDAARLIAIGWEHQQLSWQMDYRAQHDPLTGLPNRLLFEDRVNQALVRAAHERGSAAVLYIDLDRFKFVNDTLGHQAGDALLVEFARRAEALLHPTDTLARLGGDEFAIVLSAVDGPNGPAETAQRILDALRRPFLICDQEVFIGGSLGFAVYPHDAGEAAELQRRADAAMYRAKARGRNACQRFAPDMLATPERLGLESRLRRAVDNRELRLEYQPQFDAAGRLTGTEALLRWTDRELGPVSPAKFIPLAEESGLIVPLGRWVLNEACRQFKAWRRAGLDARKVAVNVSASQFLADGLPDVVARTIALHNMEPATLELEVTESLLMSNDFQTAAKLSAIRSQGVMIALDDFGTGYSSLAYLQRLPIDTLKIDRSFIADLGQRVERRCGAGVIQAIIALGHSLGMTVVAEGVETTEQHEFLFDIGCDRAQGFLYARPMAPAAIEELLKREPPRARVADAPPLPRAG